MTNQIDYIYRYKFMPFDDGTIRTISEGTMKFSSALGFNDPFDCNPYFCTENLNLLPKQRPDLFMAAGKRRGLSPAETIQRKNEFITRLRNSIVSGDFRKTTLSRVSMVCLSRNCTHGLMWSHYAASHTGFALEFKIPTSGSLSDLLKSDELLVPYEVNYQKERPKIKVTERSEAEIVKEMLLTKHDVWSYEEEERVISMERPAGIYPYERNRILCSVIAGAMMQEPEKVDLREIVESIAPSCSENLKFYEAKMSDETYEIYVPGHPRLSEK